VFGRSTDAAQRQTTYCARTGRHRDVQQAEPLRNRPSSRGETCRPVLRFKDRRVTSPMLSGPTSSQTGQKVGSTMHFDNIDPPRLTRRHCRRDRCGPGGVAAHSWASVSTGSQSPASSVLVISNAMAAACTGRVLANRPDLDADRPALPPVTSSKDLAWLHHQQGQRLQRRSAARDHIRRTLSGGLNGSEASFSLVGRLLIIALTPLITLGNWPDFSAPQRREIGRGRNVKSDRHPGTSGDGPFGEPAAATTHSIALSRPVSRMGSRCGHAPRDDLVCGVVALIPVSGLAVEVRHGIMLEPAAFSGSGPANFESE
jgi:hypothetical protein